MDGRSCGPRCEAPSSHHSILTERQVKQCTRRRRRAPYADRAPRFRLASSECKHVSLDAWVEEFDLERPILNGLRLPNELVKPLFRDHAVPLLVDLGAVSVPRRASIEEH